MSSALPLPGANRSIISRFRGETPVARIVALLGRTRTISSMPFTASPATRPFGPASSLREVLPTSFPARGQFLLERADERRHVDLMRARHRLAGTQHGRLGMHPRPLQELVGLELVVGELADQRPVAHRPPPTVSRSASS